MQKLNVFLFLVLFTTCLFSQNKPAYKLYNSNGRKVSYKKMIRKLKKADVVLFGEYHNNPITHWLQYEVTKDLHSLRSLILGAEMLERDNQQVVNSYLENKLSSKQLSKQARLWHNFKTDYKPLLDFAKENQLKFIATNIPRRYAKQVYKNGFKVLDTLPSNEKSWIAPLPIKYNPQLPSYKRMTTMMKGHGGKNLPKAQAIKDATMAYSIISNFKKGKLLIHYNGAYHSDNYEGIYWYLKQKQPHLKIATITTLSQENVKKFNREQRKKADFIIVVSKTMTTTY